MELIKDVVIKKLHVACDERGRLMEILRCDEKDIDVKFGQVYMTTAYPGVVKAWHFHEKQDDYFTCVSGMMKLVLYDSREDSETNGKINEFFIGVHNRILVRIPKLVYHGFKCISEEESIIINTVSEPYNYETPDEFRIDPHDGFIPYCWGRKDR